MRLQGSPTQRATGQHCETISISCAGHPSQVHLAIASFGLPIAFSITGGQVHDTSEAPALIESLPGPTELPTDQGYNSEAMRQQTLKGAIPNRPREKTQSSGMLC